MRKMLMGLIIVGLGCFAILFSLVKASDHKAQNPSPARHGVLDLSVWDFQGEQVVSLDGQWEFYWDQLLRPGEHLLFLLDICRYPVFGSMRMKTGV